MIAGEVLAQPRNQPPTPPASIPGAPPAQGSSRGENFSAGKSPAQLFASDCTGGGCHRGPQGLAKDRGQLGLASFLREHYTNSRESAAALASYLASAPADTRRQQGQPDQAAPGARPPRAAAARPDDPTRPPEDVGPASRTRRQQAAPGEPGDIAQPEPARPASPPARAAQRGRQTTAVPVAAPEPAPPPAPPPPQRQDYDIFD